MKLPSLKRRNPIVYISLSLYILLIALTIIESCMGNSLSGSQSDFFAKISAFFVNIINGPQVVEKLEPIGIGSVSDSSYLGYSEDGVSNIAIGTTTLVSVEIKYPNKKHKDDVYDKSYTIDKVLGDDNDYTTVMSSHTGQNDTYYIDMRIVANELSDELYQIDINLHNNVKYSHKFHIVELAKPTSYEMRLNKTNLKKGESVTIDTKLLGEKRNDSYLRRYFDLSKLDRSSSNDSVATIDEYGVIHAINEGSATITYGTNSFDIDVSNESIVKPSGNELLVNIDEDSNDNPSLLDYDYVFEDGEDSNHYSTLIYADFDDDTLEDKTVSWTTSDPLKVKLAPYKYDEEGYPIYHDDDNKPCVRVCGYRKKGDVNITCISNADNTLTKSINLNVDEALPTGMDINIIDNEEIIAGKQKILSATFNPKNVNNRDINVEVSDTSLIEVISNNSASVTLNTLKAGTCHIKVKSLANESLISEFDIKIIAKQVINDDNFTDFASFMRKFAGHFTLFLITAVVGYIFFATYFGIDKYLFAVIPTLSTGLFTAGLSEFIQIFVDGRSGTPLDVGIDFAGCFVGVLLSFIVFLVINIIRKKKMNKEKIK